MTELTRTADILSGTPPAEICKSGVAMKPCCSGRLNASGRGLPTVQRALR
jgi:hypothetical protein